MKSHPQAPCFEAELGKFWWLSKGIYSPGMPKLCPHLQCLGSRVGRGRWWYPRGRQGSPLSCNPCCNSARCAARHGQGPGGRGKEAAPCGQTKAGGPGCRAGCVHPPDAQLGREPLLSLPPRRRAGGWKERVKAGAVEQPSASMYVAAEASVPNQIIIKPNQNNANIQHRLVLKERCLFLLISSVKPVTLGREAQREGPSQGQLSGKKPSAGSRKAPWPG